MIESLFFQRVNGEQYAVHLHSDMPALEVVTEIARVPKDALLKIPDSNEPGIIRALGGGAIQFDTELGEITFLDEKPPRQEELTRVENRLLTLLTSKPGRLMTKQVITEEVFGGHTTDGNINSQTGYLRKKLGIHRDLIRTKRGVGLYFEES